MAGKAVHPITGGGEGNRAEASELTQHAFCASACMQTRLPDATPTPHDDRAARLEGAQRSAAAHRWVLLQAISSSPSHTLTILGLLNCSSSCSHLNWLLHETGSHRDDLCLQRCQSEGSSAVPDLAYDDSASRATPQRAAPTQVLSLEALHQCVWWGNHCAYSKECAGQQCLPDAWPRQYLSGCRVSQSTTVLRTSCG